MKKFLLLGAAAMMACAANAQTITKVWEMPTPADQGIYYVTGFGNKIYTCDNATGFVTEYENGAATGKSWNVNQVLVDANETYESTGEDGTVTVNQHKMWRSITSDDAGNVLVNAAFAQAANSTKWIVIPADGSDMQMLNIELPSGVTAGRLDTGVGRIIGDVFSDAYLPLLPATATAAAVVNLFPGETGAIEYLLETSFSVPLGFSGSSQSNIAILADYSFFENGPTTEEVGAVIYGRQARTSSTMFAWDGAGLNAYNDAEGKAIGTDGASNTGFDVFTIGETSYYVVPCKDKDGGSANGRTTAFDIRNLATGALVAQYKTGSATDTANSSLTARVNEDGKTATIYACNDKDKMGVYTFDPEGASAIEEIAADNAVVEYYNLQGVKVANPENGIFVKKQGAKATKVVL